MAKKTSKPMEDCWDCGGRGWWEEMIPMKNFWSFFSPTRYRRVPCDTCEGSGKVECLICVACGSPQGNETSKRGEWGGQILCHLCMWDEFDPGKPARLIDVVPGWEALLRLPLDQVDLDPEAAKILYENLDTLYLEG